jgi:F1F0 ATPase subunit 2
MIEMLPVVLSALAGLAIGAVFFGGLWWTVLHGVQRKHVAVWFTGSLLVRGFVALSGFYLVGHEHWDRLVSCLLGFLLARLVTTWVTRPRTVAATGRRETTLAP